MKWAPFYSLYSLVISGWLSTSVVPLPVKEELENLPTLHLLETQGSDDQALTMIILVVR